MAILFKLTDDEAKALNITSADEIRARLTPVTAPAPVAPSAAVAVVTPPISAAVSPAPTAEPSIEQRIAAAVTAAVGDVDDRIKSAIAAAAVETMAAAGVQPVAASPSAKPMSKSELMAEMNAITDPRARGAFYAAHRSQLLNQ